ncbi:MAG: methyltransferase domain-containing protein [Chloroflexota bacterium]|jgi:SAM-dependent methyltransferase|nr:methyltransferase domain-containing protein [Chloroflexota bacterium]MDP6507557.1 methyltransferase domain-containing protein [Chloroflexota bacterium]MDP6758512.1 methyltransferase domain-containing protein [Chloroflexota bacterium]
MRQYVHGYSDREAGRLADQADSVRELIHGDTLFAPGDRVLEPGCGIGAQTFPLARCFPQVRFTSFDLSAGSLERASASMGEVANVNLLRADLMTPPFKEGEFDVVLVSYLLEHVPDPARALAIMQRLLKPGGKLYVVEGDHGSCYFHPETDPARRAWACLIEVQRRLEGDSLIGRRLYPLLTEAGFADVKVSPRMVYADESRPHLMVAFVEKTIVPMVQGAREAALEWGLIDADTFDRGIDDLMTVSQAPGGAFCYTFFKATASQPETRGR